VDVGVVTRNESFAALSPEFGPAIVGPDFEVRYGAVDDTSFRYSGKVALIERNRDAALLVGRDTRRTGGKGSELIPSDPTGSGQLLLLSDLFFEDRFGHQRQATVERLGKEGAGPKLLAERGRQDESSLLIERVLERS